MASFSSDLTSPNFFMWLSQRQNLCKFKALKFWQIERCIHWDMRNICNEVFPKVMHNIAVHMQNVIGLFGAYVKHVM